jgi:ceramide glucosyltransferase
LDAPFNLLPVTVLKPLKGIDSGLRENLKSFFSLDYPNYELIFSVADSRDPAYDVISELIRRHPEVPARLLIGDIQIGPNPKINNLIRGYREARHDWLVISDSNVRVQPDFLKRLVAQLDPGVGMVTSMVAGLEPRGMGGALETTFLHTFYARGMAMAFAANHPIVIGKCMMFRRSTAQRFGGIEVLAQYLAEDYIAGEAIRHLGLKVLLSGDPVVQYIGSYSLKEFWLRHIRWGRLRKVQSPLTFFFEPFFGCFSSGLLGAMALKCAAEVPLPLSLALHFGIWSICDWCLMRRLGQEIDVRLPLIWFLREFLTIPMWLHIVSGNTVIWRGRKLKLHPGGILET